MVNTLKMYIALGHLVSPNASFAQLDFAFIAIVINELNGFILLYLFLSSTSHAI